MTKVRINWIFWFGLLLLSMVIAMALISLVWTPYDAFTINEENRLSRPTVQHWLGTDLLGRDLLSRMMIAGQTALSLAAGVVSIALAGGLLLTLTITISPKWLRLIALALIDMIMIFPTIILALVMISLFGSGLKTMLWALAIANIPRFAKVSLAVIREQQGAEYLAFAQSLGQPAWRIMVRHFLPSMRLPLIHTIIVSLASVILSESSLSFLGLGIVPPQPSWGYTLNEAKSYLFSHWHLSIAPLLAIFSTILSLNLISNAFNKNK